MQSVSFCDDDETNDLLNVVVWNLSRFFEHSSTDAVALVHRWHSDVARSELRESPYRVAALMHYLSKHGGGPEGFAMWSAIEGHDNPPEESLVYSRLHCGADDTIKTNRDFYLAIIELINRQARSSRTLEEYLLALLPLVRESQAETSLSVYEFYCKLAAAFYAPASTFDEAWRSRSGIPNAAGNNFECWEAAIVQQIVDLREMDETGALKNEMRYYGIESPRGDRWYNFDPCTYIECATASSLDGWEPDDASGRTVVPGPVAAVNEQGEIVSCDPYDLDSPIYTMEAVSWEDFCHFLWNGQCYE